VLQHAEKAQHSNIDRGKITALLASGLTYMTTTGAFKVKLKTYLFSRFFCTALWAINVGTTL